MEELKAEMIGWRHDFHQHPELGFAEHRTSERVAELLTSFGLEVHRNIGQTGVVGVLQRGNGDGCIALRADMDALPLTETGTPAHKSKHDGVMHACGHDGHTSMLLGAAKHLAEKGDFNGRAVFIFQPNEEHGEGAKAMIADGLFEKFSADAVYAMHNMPGMPAGHFATRAGGMTASESLFEIIITARGGHAALPHMGVDAIIVGAQLVTALQSIVSRKLDPAVNGVVSVTEFITDGRRNVLPGQAILRGDARALTTDTNTAIEANMRRIAAGIAMAHDVKIDVSYDTIFPSTPNDPVAAAMAIAAARDVAVNAAGIGGTGGTGGKGAKGDAGNAPDSGDILVDGDCLPKLFSEDFSHMARTIPGCFMLIGNGTSGPSAQPLHSTNYDFNDDILVPGASYITRLVEMSLPT